MHNNVDKYSTQKRSEKGRFYLYLCGFCGIIEVEKSSESEACEMTEFELSARLNFLKNLVKYQAEELSKANEKIEKLKTENKELKAELDRKTELLKLAAAKAYGRSSERILLDDGQLNFFGEEEKEAVEKEAPKTVIAAHVRRKKRTYKEIYGNLPETEVVYDLREDEKKCERCGSEMTLMKYDERIEITVVPARFNVIKYLTAIYVCKNCADELDKNGDSHTMFKKAHAPAPLITGSTISPELAAYEIFKKFAMHIPLNRIEYEYKMSGFRRPKQTICNNLIQLAELLEPLYELLHRELCRLRIIHTDETTMQVNLAEGHFKPIHCYFWAYCSGKYEKKKIVLFEFCKGRASDYPCSFLKGFRGYGHCDGLRQYDDVVGLIRVGCWAHLRRYFYDAVKVQADKKDYSTVAGQGFLMINAIFRAERKDPEKPHDDAGLTLKEIAHIRKTRSAALVKKFFEWCSEKASRFLPSELTRKAVNYALNQKRSLEMFLRDPRLEMTNNAAERAIRPVTVGRKNWLFAQSEKGAKSSAIFFSMIETAKASMLKPYEYLKWIFEQIRLGTAKYTDLLPWSGNIPQYVRMEAVL